MQTLTNLTVLIPLHKSFDNEDTELFNKAIETIKTNKKSGVQNILIVHTQELENYPFDTTLLEGFNTQYLLNTTPNTDYQSQINLGASNVQTDYFMILEQDDAVSDITFDSFHTYSSYYKNVSVFLPLVVETDANNNFIKFNSVETLSRGIVGEEGEIGVITHKIATTLQSQILSGGFYKTEDFIAIGGFKKNMGFAFAYEYLMRSTHNDQIVFIIPKLCYVHKNNRVGSYLYDLNQKNITQTEITFWFDQAKKEYYFAKDRNVYYKLPETENV